MPVAVGPDAPKPAEKPNLVINPIPYEGAVVDSRKESYDTVTTFQSGQKWACDAYPQILMGDDAPASYDPDKPIAYGQYKKIRDFELVVSQQLRSEQLEGARGFKTTGAGSVYSVYIPSEGDLFVAEANNGKNAMFMFTSTKRLTIYDESPTEVEYVLMKYMDAETEARLERHVQQTYYFDRELFRSGLKCILTLEEVQVNLRLANAFKRLVGSYFHDFFSGRFHTFILPKQERPTYDPAVVRFIRAILSTMMHPQFADITELGVGHDVHSNQLTIFDVILKKDPTLLYSCCQKSAVSDISRFRALPLMNSIYFSGIKAVVMPTDTSYTVNDDWKGPEAYSLYACPIGTPDIPLGQVQKADVVRSTMDQILPVRNLIDGSQEPQSREGSYIHRVVADDYYVFTEAFYKDTNGKSDLESILLDRLNGRAVDLGRLADIADYAMKFDNLERFYYIPIILALIKLAPGVV